MKFELEIKYRVKNFEKVNSAMQSKFCFLKKFCKTDYYYTLNGKTFRIRNDSSKNYFITVKEKKLENKMECNKEIEFSVENLLLPCEFANYLGANLDYIKEKKGNAYKYDKYLLELSTLKYKEKIIGNFLEIETIQEEKNNKINEEIKKIAKELELFDCDIEIKTYKDLIFDF